MKLVTPISFFVITLLFLSCSQTAENTETIDLKLLYKIGDQQTIVSAIETKGNSMMSMSNEMEATFTVTSIEEEIGYTFMTDVIAIRSKTKMGNEVESYDSQKKEANMTADEKSIHTEFKKALDINYKISIDEKGRITKPFSHEDGELTSGSILDMNNIQLTFPDKKVSVGSEWEDEKVNDLTMQKIVSNYKIKKITNDKIIITVKSKIPAISTVLKANEAIGEYELDKATCNLIKGQKEMKLAQGGKVIYRFYKK